MNTTTQHTIADDGFSRDLIDLANGAAFDLVAVLIRKRIGDAEHHKSGKMLTSRVVA